MMANTKNVGRKRGRPPAGPIAGKSSTLGLRVKPETRTALEQAAKLSGRTMSQEAEVRLIQSFDDDSSVQKTIQAFGGPDSAIRFQVCWHAIRALEFGAGRRWFDDPYLYRIACETIADVLRYVAPHGDELPQTLPSNHIARAFKPEALSRILASTALAALSPNNIDGEVGTHTPEQQWDGLPLSGEAMTRLVDRVLENLKSKVGPVK